MLCVVFVLIVSQSMNKVTFTTMVHPSSLSPYLVSEKEGIQVPKKGINKFNTQEWKLLYISCSPIMNSWTEYSESPQLRDPVSLA